VVGARRGACVSLAYHQEQFAAELWLGSVPLFASLSFAFLSYFSFSAACGLRARWNGAGATGPEPILATAVLAAVIGTWMDTVIDPLTLIGEHWFLGDLYHYDPPGPHFGVPLVNYAGWMVTIGAIVIANLLLDRVLARRGVPLGRRPALPGQRFWGLGCCIGVFVFMLGVNVQLLVRAATPADVPVERILASGVVSFVLFLAFVAMMSRRGVARADARTRVALR
jgi:putative membrane protein